MLKFKFINRLKRNWISIIFALFLFTFLILFAYKVTLATSSLSNNQQETIDYLNYNREISLNYTSAEISHLQDVQVLMNNVDYTLYLSLLICTLILTLQRRKKEKFRRSLLYGGVITIVFTFLILVISLISFTSAFNFFHRIFFPQGNWLFSFNSLLIQTFSLKFFIDISIRIFLITIFGGIVFIILSRLIKR
ncbi:hypothetical protein COY27_02980 [Candidatus Woesearchaeota archaeon CG_4_10_14_0_2_um_filter_33_13]|nr:MAG: hypothetical protein COY27_02980 [Candidatus Woesearchaeota archaeon CG_4_10_14_0_2_um_filter_33_13]